MAANNPWPSLSCKRHHSNRCLCHHTASPLCPDMVRALCICVQISLVFIRTLVINPLWSHVNLIIPTDTLEKEMATHSSISTGRIPWTEEPSGLQSMGLQRVRHDWVTSLSQIRYFQTWYIHRYCTLKHIFGGGGVETISPTTKAEF